LRSLRREPLFALAAIATLALGIGLNTAVFGVVYGLLLRPPALPEADRLVTIEQTYHGREIRSAVTDVAMLSWEEYEAFRAGNRTLDGLAALAPVVVTLRGDEPVRVTGALVTCNYFEVTRAAIPLGRAFAPAECAGPGEAAVVILSWAFWQRQFAGSPAVLGRSIEFNRQPFTVIGIAARGFGGTDLRMRDLWIPVTLQPRLGDDLLSKRSMSWLTPLGRMRPGVTPAQVESDLTRVARQAEGNRSTVHAEPERLIQFGDETLLVAFVVMTLPALLLAMSCLNVMNLLLARAPARRRAIRIRLSLGAGRARVVTQLLVESLLLAGLGGAAGFALARATPALVLAALPFPGGQLDLSPDLRVFGFALLVSLVAAGVFGVVPALEATHVDLASALRGAGPGGGSSARSARARGMVMGVQLAGSLLMLVLAGLFVRALAHARALDLGYTIDNVYAFRPDLAREGYDATRAAAFYREFVERVTRLPAVEGAALASQLPLGGHSSGAFHREESADTMPPFVQAFSIAVSAEYFRLMHIPIVSGRAFTPDDVRSADATPAVISEHMAARFWPGEDALGRRFRVAREKKYIVVGIARDARNLGLDGAPVPFFYGAIRLDPWLLPGVPMRPAPDFALVVRVSGERAVDAVRQAAKAIDPAVLVETQSLAARLADRLGPTRTASLFAGLLGGLATLLAIIGVYCGIAYAASQRTREIGVRLALGATHADIVRMMMRQGRTPLIAGLLSGALLATGAAQVVRSLLFGLSPVDPLAFAGTTLLLAALAALAMYRPARRAARLDPVTTLRTEGW
jgi:predicted permease